MARTVPVAVTEVPGNFNTAALNNATVGAWITFGTTQPLFSGVQGTAQSIPNGTWTSFTIDTELTDADGIHSTVTNTSRVTPNVPGSYLLIGTSGWAGNVTGKRWVRLALNGAAINGTACGSDAHTSLNVGGHTTATIVNLNGSTDYVEVQGQQASGGALNTNVTDFAPSLRVFWISR
ncbi:hypothetical protein [Streptomyces sp. NPDC051994]|uniref:hypothetical protein n=1 Tax=unclassified Streptomyces TaxID=2593676 RepID=UPI003443D4E6